MSDEYWARQSITPPAKSMNTPQDFPRNTDDPVASFAARMRAELAANEHKGDRENWRKTPPKELLLQIGWHTIKLGAALRAGDLEAIGEYSADVGNMAMMIADAYGLL